MTEIVKIHTRQRVEFINITSQVKRIVEASGIKEGLCTVYCPHTTAGITINEAADPAVIEDIMEKLNKTIPFRNGYTHMEGNSAAHIKSSLFGCSASIIIKNGRLALGTWQSVFFCEFDGPRTRAAWIEITGS